ncbi:GIY-YIG nuclease family protein [Sporosarcina highlanderae]|uniref:GIY-YIG nuclease family protein n=1 Tax=Sporosarcina highlanderae TaxID=3035916 RepID=A0ABT8JVI9_9BACL|nr:GIY-YIG nuclease family protein [Sporosarcina highlanderae]MDN4608872.1 GIY-YIG nuclease family protein [Sporosarcina highlanderae]
MDKGNEHFFYVLECKDGTYYAGYTNDLEKRVRVHNEGKGAKYTRARIPVRCIYMESFETKREAMRAEYQFKQLTRNAKERYMRKGQGTDEITKKC